MEEGLVGHPRFPVRSFSLVKRRKVLDCLHETNVNDSPRNTAVDEASSLTQAGEIFPPLKGRQKG